MGGKGPKKPKMQPVPKAAEPLDYEKMFAAARENSRLIGQDQIDQLKSAYPEFEKLQLGTIAKVSANLDNESYREAKAGLDAVDPRNNAISKQLNASALADLQLGRSLTPEQERAATQAARAGMSARGLGVGNAALAAEVLNRDAYASQREAQRRTFAGAVMADTNQTALNVANQRMNYDPYQRAFAPGASFGQGLSGQAGGMLGQAYGTALNTVTSTNSFNANMLESRRNTVQNNNAALQSAYMGAKASENAANMGLQGAAMGASAVVGAAAAACWIARAAFGTATTRWKEYRRAMLRHASDRTIRLYCQHGQALAARLTTPLRRLAARLTLRTLEWSWN
jgi:hypothetical protein